MEIFSEIISSLARENEVMLATVVSTSGSTPAPALSKMLITGGGAACTGTIGGGCMEAEVVQRAARLFGTGKAELETFQLDDEDEDLICGGSLTVLLEPLTGKELPILEELSRRRLGGEDSLFCRLIRPDGTVSGKLLIRTGSGGLDPPLLQLEDLFSLKESELASRIASAQRSQSVQRLTTPRGELVLEPVGGIPRLVVFGGGHISRALVPAAAMTGFRVTVVDDREKYANPARFPEAEETIAADFTGSFLRLKVSSSDYVVIVTRGHRHDEEVLEHALGFKPRYLGMIGSRRKVLTTYRNLLDRGVPLSSLEMVHAPIGVAIGAQTAEEIALSIIAELIGVRRGSSGKQGSMSESMRPLLAQLEREAQARRVR